MLTLDHIKKRGRALANRCFLCGEVEETVDPLHKCSIVVGSPFSYLWGSMGVPFVS